MGNNTIFLSLLAGIGVGAVLFLTVFFWKLNQYWKAAAKFALFKTGVASDSRFIGEPTGFAKSFIAYCKVCRHYDEHRSVLKSGERSLRRIVLGWYYDLRKEWHDAVVRELRYVPTFIKSNYRFTNPYQIISSSFMKEWESIESSPYHSIDNAELILMILDRAIVLLQKDLELIRKSNSVKQFDGIVCFINEWIMGHFSDLSAISFRHYLKDSLQAFLVHNKKALKTMILDEMHRSLANASSGNAGKHKVAALEPLLKTSLLKLELFNDVYAEVAYNADTFLQEMYKAEKSHDERLKILNKIQTSSIKETLLSSVEQLS